jgi:hypothetical protein
MSEKLVIITYTPIGIKMLLRRTLLSGLCVSQMPITISDYEEEACYETMYGFRQLAQKDEEDYRAAASNRPYD